MTPENGWPQRPAHILMVEDDPTDAQLLEELLVSTFVAERVDHAETLEAALDRLGDGVAQLDAVLLDLGLPDATGLDAVRAVVDAAPELPIVVLTGHDDQEMALEALRERVEDYLLKGEVGPEDLARSIRYALERKRVVRELEVERRKLHRSEARYRTLVETMAEATVILDPEGRITFANDEAENLLGLTPSDAVGRSYVDSDWRITAPDGGALPEGMLPLQQVLDTGRPVRNLEIGTERSNGTRRILSLNAAPLEDPGGELEGVVCTMRDITERQRMEEELRHRALHDPLTELPNRALFENRLQQALARSRRHGGLVGLLMLDLDRFKQINDQLGHPAGDSLLEAVAERLAAGLRDEDTAARLGGDEFAIVLSALDGTEDLEGVRDRVIRTLAEPYRLGGELVEIDVSMGGVLHGGDGEGHAVRVETHDDLIRYADIALFRAKETPGPTFHLFHPDERSVRTRALDRERDLRRAIRVEEFELRWQPIYGLEDGELWGVEPLARWRHPERGLLAPAEFIFLADETGLAHELGELLFREICHEAAAWPQRESRSVRITPNISDRQLERDGLGSTLLDIVEGEGLDPARFCLDLGETVLAREKVKIARLRDAGFGVLADDFGTGYSSFQDLRDWSFDGLKIDTSFVHGLGRGDHGEALVATMVTMGRAMDLIVVGEGLETRAHRDALVELGCPLGQGFLLGRPVPADDLHEVFS